MTNTQDQQNRANNGHPGYGLIVLMSAAALALAACGNNTAGNYVPAASPPTQAAQRAPQGAFGSIAAVAASNVEVQNPQNGQVTVNYGPSTTFDTVVPAGPQDVTVGSCVTVTSANNAPTGQTLSARTVMISQPAANGGCTRAGGGAFGGGGGRQGDNANPSRRVRPSGQPNPNGPRAAFGSVTAVNGNTLTVHDTAPANGNAPADTTVTIDSSTTFTKSVSADSHALVVGKCVVAVGATDSTGAVTARSMTISTPGPNGCAAFGGRQRTAGQNGGGNG